MPTYRERTYVLRMAQDHLRLARDEAVYAGAQRTAAKIRLALTSIGGAIRHAEARDAT